MRTQRCERNNRGRGTTRIIWRQVMRIKETWGCTAFGAVGSCASSMDNIFKYGKEQGDTARQDIG